MSQEAKGYKPAEALSELARKHIDLGVNDGLFCTDVVEDIPRREKATCEKVIKGKNNAYIVLGRDRPDSIVSGAGGAGQTQCGMIDLVVGINASVTTKRMKKGMKPKGPTELVSPNFATDAARIYMSQRCPGKGGIDGYLGMTRLVGPSAENKSAIAIKSDHVRIVGRESVRIYAARAQNFHGLGLGGERTTVGNRITRGRIDLVAGREQDLQPAVLGENLREYLLTSNDRFVDVLRILSNVVQQLLETELSVIMFNPLLSKNFVQNIMNMFDTLLISINKAIDSINYLDNLVISGNRSILSNTVYIT